MQDTLRVILWTIVGIVIIWLIAMTIDLYTFLHIDSDNLVYGSVSINRTDIGDRCGSEYINSPVLVYFKLNSKNQIIFLCPQTLSPIRSRIVAITIPNQFKKILTPAQLLKVNAAYPVIQQVAPPLVPQPGPMSNVPPP